jgi:hypothetical protein
MPRLGIAFTVVGALCFAAPALASPGQCYDAYGRPVGPVYDTDRPNYRFINSVIRRGGSCTGVRSDYDASPNYYYSPKRQYNRHYRRDYYRD